VENSERVCGAGPDRVVRRDRGAYIEQVIEAGFPPLEPGHEYLLFVRWRDTDQGWVVAYGADGVIELGNGNVRSAGNAKITNTY
jgi:hypothetical protein